MAKVENDLCICRGTTGGEEGRGHVIVRVQQ